MTQENFQPGEDKYWHFILLAKNEEGHRQIREISARAWKRSWKIGKMRRRPTYYQDLIDIIYPNQGNVIGSTACLGGWLAAQSLKYAEKPNEELKNEITNWLRSIVKLFGEGNFYIELQPPEKKNNEQYKANAVLLQFAKELNIPWIITTDSHYKCKEDRPIHKAYLTSQEGEREVDSFYATTYLMSTEELESHFDFSIEEGYQNIQNILDMCEDYELEKSLKIPRLPWKVFNPISAINEWYSKFPTIEKFVTSQYKEDNELAKAIIEKLEKEPKLQDSIIYEMIEDNLQKIWDSSEVNNARWSAYLLNLQKIIDCCWEAGSIVLPARGSGGGFILLYILDIIQMNPAWEKIPLRSWRFLNPSRVSPLDVDFDIEGAKRNAVLAKFREVYGEDRICNVATFGHEKAKAAIKTAARGLGMEIEDAEYFASLIPADRGIQRTLKQCYYGDIENDMKPIFAFVQAMDSNPSLWKIAQKVEGLVCQLGSHAGGVVFFDEEITNNAGIMRTPEGTIVSCYELHDLEHVSAIKYDCLSVEAADKIHTCLDLLIKDGVIQPEPTLKETYLKYLGVYNIDRTSPEMWDMVDKGQILSLFQMEKASGVQGIRLTHPRSVEDLAHLNSIIRLMAPDKDSEMPLEKYARYKKDINLWYQEMAAWGLTAEEQDVLKPLFSSSYGLCEAQELFMEVVQIPECGGFDLDFADRLRKSIAKKSPAEYDRLTEEYFRITKEKGCSANLCNYVWKMLVATSRGYGFNLAHTLGYSLVALQEMNLAYHYPIIYWNTACLLVNSGSFEAKEGDEASTNYVKMAQALGATINAGIKVSLVDINRSDFGFSPDVKNNQIRFGLKGLSNVGDEIIKEIIANRPYISPKDFLNRVKPKRQVMISLIKAGAFDNMLNRKLCMAWYIWETCDKKKRLTLQNLSGLIKYKLLPEKTEEQIMARRIYEFNRYLKATCKANNDNYRPDERAIAFLNEIEQDKLVAETGLMSAKEWDKKVYQSWMDVFRNWINVDKEQILQNLNEQIFIEDWEKYATGSISAWEMEAMCFYYHEHELAHVNTERYGLSDFGKLPEEPIVERNFVTKNGYKVNIYKLTKICGTCIAKDNTKSSITLLTTSGTVQIKFPKDYYNLFNRRISEIQEDRTKKIVEYSWFDKGSMIIVQGYRSGSNFIPKKYSSTPGHQLYHILEVLPNGELTLQNARHKGDLEDE